MHVSLQLATFGNLFGVDGLIILAIGLLIFGRRLPEVGKNLGKTIVEFKKGLSGTYTEDAAKTEEPVEEEAPAPAPRRLASGSASRPAQAAARRRLPETEEV